MRSTTKPASRAKSDRARQPAPARRRPQVGQSLTPASHRPTSRPSSAPAPQGPAAADLASVRGLLGAVAALRALAARMGRVLLGEESSRAAVAVTGAFYGILAALVAIVDGWGTQAAIDAAEDIADRARDLVVALRATVPRPGEPRDIPRAVHRVDDITGAIVDARRALDDLCIVGEDAARPPSAQQLGDHAATMRAHAFAVLRALRTAELAAADVVEAPSLAVCILDPRTKRLHGFEHVERHDGRGFVIVLWENDPAEMARALTHSLRTKGSRNVLAAAAKLLPPKDLPKTTSRDQRSR